jgi:integrase
MSDHKRRKPWSEYTRPSGATTFKIRRNRQAATLTTHDKVAGRRWAAATVASMDKGDWVDPRAGSILLRDWVPTWFESKRHLSTRYQTDIRGLYTNWVDPYFGHLPIKDIDPESVKRWLREITTGEDDEGKAITWPLSKRGNRLAPGKVHQARLVLSGCLELAADIGMIPRNQANGKQVRRTLPRIPTKPLNPQDIPTEVEVNRAIFTMTEPYSVLVETLAYGALRLAEGLALQPGDVSDRGIMVSRVYTKNPEGRGPLVVKAPKSGKPRWVPLNTDTVARLMDLIEHSEVGPTDLMFPGEKGGPMHPSTWHKVWWLPMLDEAGLRPLRSKHLRNFGAMQFLEAGANIEQLRQLLGHQSITTTQKYIDAYEDQLGLIADRVGEQRRRSLGPRSVPVPQSG